MAYVYWALEWKTMRAKHIDIRSLSATRGGAWTHVTGPNATQVWKDECARRRKAGRIKAVKVVVLTLEDYRKLENP